MRDHVELNDLNGEIGRELENTVEPERETSDASKFAIADFHAALGTGQYLQGEKTHVDLSRLDENRRPMHRDDAEDVNGWNNFWQTQDAPPTNIGQTVDADLGTGQSHRVRMRQDLGASEALVRFAKPTQYDRYDPDHPLVSSNEENDRTRHTPANNIGRPRNAGSAGTKGKGPVWSVVQVSIARAKGEGKVATNVSTRGAEQNPDRQHNLQTKYGGASISSKQTPQMPKGPIKGQLNRRNVKDSSGLSNTEPRKPVTCVPGVDIPKQSAKANNIISGLAIQTVNLKQPGRSSLRNTLSQAGKVTHSRAGGRPSQPIGSLPMVWGNMGPVRKLASPNEFMAHNNVALQPPWPQRIVQPKDAKEDGDPVAVAAPGTEHSMNAQGEEHPQHVTERHLHDNSSEDTEDTAIVENHLIMKHENRGTIGTEVEEESTVQIQINNTAANDLRVVEDRSSVGDTLVNGMQRLSIESTEETRPRAINLIDMEPVASTYFFDTIAHTPSLLDDLLDLDFSCDIPAFSNHFSALVPSLLDDNFDGPLVYNPIPSLIPILASPGDKTPENDAVVAGDNDVGVVEIRNGDATGVGKTIVAEVGSAIDQASSSGRNGRSRIAVQTPVQNVANGAPNEHAKASVRGSRDAAPTKPGNASLSKSIWANASDNARSNHGRR